MAEKINPKLKKFSQKLRKDMTKEERHLWYTFLKRLPVTIHRQKVMGPYVADFYCASAKIIIELDGTQHFLDNGIAKDKERDDYFSSRGIKVLRYSNRDVNTNFNGICEDILEHFNIKFQ